MSLSLSATSRHNGFHAITGSNTVQHYVIKCVSDLPSYNNYTSGLSEEEQVQRATEESLRQNRGILKSMTQSD
jgi:hypothetical protein